MQIIDVLEAVGERAKALPEDMPLEAVVRVRFLRRRGVIEADVRLSDGRRSYRRTGRGVTSREALLDAVA
ncbi:MAG: hypothetical protein HY907_11515 [Deltaproteobacteria bacterium]|nr:hypothetical protein [Deltaproteobacteria bacterium]MBI5500861.1 hypothetical protein [Deltaproteobacteria bacterium]